MEGRIIGVKRAAASAPKSPVKPAARLAPHPSAAAVRHLAVDDEDAGQRLDNFLLRQLKGVPKTHV